MHEWPKLARPAVEKVLFKLCSFVLGLDYKNPHAVQAFVNAVNIYRFYNETLILKVNQVHAWAGRNAFDKCQALHGTDPCTCLTVQLSRRIMFQLHIAEKEQ